MSPTAENAQSTHTETPPNGQSPPQTTPTATTNKPYPAPEAEYQEIAQNPNIFLDKLQSFHQSSGTHFKVPTIGGKTLDLHRLFVEVTSRGGILKVLTDRKWKEVILVFHFPSTITSASFVLRKYYMSVLYHFEQVYYFRKKVPSIYAAESPGSTVNGSAPLHVLEDDAPMNQFSESSYLEPGSKVRGTIDAKFDFGYLVSVNLGSERLNGVLYHIPTDLHMSQSCDPYTAPPHRSRKRYQLSARDPSRPKSNRRDYNISFAEHQTYLKPLQQEDWTSVEQTN